MAQAAITPQLLALFSTLVEEMAGIVYGPQDRELFANKLVDHALEVGYDSLLDYYYRVRYDDRHGVELRRLIEGLLVHETYFFRELPALIALVDHHIAKVVRTHGRARVWSAACSTGEEPYTLAMLLDSRGLLDNVEIVATDFSTAALARAGNGRHSRRSLREGYPADLAARYLEVSEHGVLVAPRIRNAVRFSHLNLTEDAAIARLGLFDAILCRNVFIYFRDERVVHVLDRLDAALAPGGLLAVGVAESLLRFGTSLQCVERSSSFFYRKAGP